MQTLVERYGCIAGHPDRTFRGDRVITRYEFAVYQVRLRMEDRKQELEDFLERIPSIALNLTIISTKCGLLIERVKVGK